MNFITLGIGILALLYGCFTIIMRIKNPDSFGKIESMKKFWGEKMGFVIHVTFYTVAPIIGGIIFIILGIQGKSIY